MIRKLAPADLFAAYPHQTDQQDIRHVYSKRFHVLIAASRQYRVNYIGQLPHLAVQATEVCRSTGLDTLKQPVSGASHLQQPSH